MSAIDRDGRTIWIVEAHRDGKRFAVRADEKLTAFLGIGISNSISKLGAPAEKLSRTAKTSAYRGKTINS